MFKPRIALIVTHQNLSFVGIVRTLVPCISILFDACLLPGQTLVHTEHVSSLVIAVGTFIFHRDLCGYTSINIHFITLRVNPAKWSSCFRGTRVSRMSSNSARSSVYIAFSCV